MTRTLFAVIIAAGLTWTSAAAPPGTYDSSGSATIGSDGGKLTLTGAEVAYHARATRIFTLTIQNRTSKPLDVMLTNFQLRETTGDRPDCPGQMGSADAKTTSAGASACQSPTRKVRPGRSARFTIVPAVEKVGKTYKFDIVAKPDGAPQPTVFDPELIIDSPTAGVPPTPSPHR